MEATLKRSHFETIYRTIAGRGRRPGGGEKWLYFSARALVALQPAIDVIERLRRPTPGLEKHNEADFALIAQHARRLPDGGIAGLGQTGAPDCASPDFYAQRAALRAEYAEALAADEQRAKALQMAMDEEVTLAIHGVKWSDLPEDIGATDRAILWPVIIDDHQDETPPTPEA
jgi:hypothetical protein